MVLFLCAFLGVGIFIAPSRAESAAGVPRIMSYQGRLTNASGDLLGGSGTSYYFRFSLYGASSGGSQLWPAGSATPCTHTLPVKEGVFNAGIGDTSECSDALNYDFASTDALYLQVQVSSDNSTFETLTPRQRVTSSAFAAIADSVVSTSTQSRLGTTSPIGTSLLTIEASTSSVVPLSIRAAAGQTANILQIQNAAAADFFTIAGSGRIGIASSTPGAGFGIATSTYIAGGLGVGVATTTANNFQLQGDAQIAGALSASGAISFGSTIAATGLASFSGGILVNAASSTIINLSLLSATATQATTSYLAVTSNASTSNLFVQGTAVLSGSTTIGTSSTNILTITSTTTLQNGITIQGGASITGAGGLSVSGPANLTSGNAYFINGTSVLNGTTLGSGITTANGITSASSLATVGTLTSGSLGAGFTTVAVARGGTGVTTFGGTNTLLYTTSADTLSSITTVKYPFFRNGILKDFSAAGQTLPAAF